MKQIWICRIGLFVLPAHLVVAQQAALVIDDRTALDNGQLVHRAVPAAAPLSARPAAAAPAVPRAPGDGYAACSTSADAYPFDLGGSGTGTAIVLPGSSNYAYDATMRPDGSEIWIADASADSVLVIDRASDTVTHQIPVCNYAVSVAFSKDQTFALVTCRSNVAGVNNIVRVSTSSHTVSGGWVGPLTYLGPGNVTLDPVSGNFYMVQWYSGALHEISADGTTLLRSANLGTSLWQLVVDPDGSVVYVTDRATHQVRVIDRATLTQLNAVAACTDPWGLDVTPDGSKLVVTCEDSHDVARIDTTTWAGTLVSVNPGDPRDVDVSPDGTRAFVAGGDSGAQDVVYVIDIASATLTGTIPLPAGASNVNVVAATPQPVPVELMSVSVE